MSIDQGRYLTREEKAEIEKRKNEIKTQKRNRKASSLDDLKKELGISKKEPKQCLIQS